MLKNYLTVAVRNLIRHKGYSAINIAGLAVGMAFCILTFMYVQHEWSYDTFHQNADRIYRVYQVNKYATGEQVSVVTPTPLAPTMKENFSEVVRAVRFWRWFDTTVHYGDNLIGNNRLVFADPEVFDVFSFPQVQGNLKIALYDKNSVVMTQDMVKKYFGDKDPLGKSVSILMGRSFRDFVVKGVVEIPENSSIQFDFAVSFENALKQGTRADDWSSSSLITYIQLSGQARASDLEQKLPRFVETYFGAVIEYMRKGFKGYGQQLRLQPLTEVHLNPAITFGGMTPPSNPLYVYILSGIALSVLLVACVNFMNLSVGLASTRFREVGVRKVLGATRSRLAGQFWGEAVLLSLIAMFAGVALAEQALPTFNNLVERRLTLHYRSMWFTLVGLALMVGCIAGSYPALTLSRFQPVDALKGKLKIGGGNWFSRGLVVLQFSLSVILIVTTLVIARQMNFLRAKDLGFKKEHVVVIHAGWELGGSERRRFVDLLRHEVAPHGRIVGVSAAGASFGDDKWGSCKDLTYEGHSMKCYFHNTDYDFLKTLELELAEGRDFSKDFPTDVKESVLVNEAFVRQLGLRSPIGKKAPRFGKTIVGIVKDFHLLSLHHDIVPVVLELGPDAMLEYIFVRLGPDRIPTTLGLLKEKWQEIVPYKPFVYSFLDEDVAQQYRAEKRWERIVHYSAAFAILIACLGAFGLTSLAVARRTKEIGIRKVLGASVSNIVMLLSREFVLLVGIANLIAWPVAYYAMRWWLENFAYRIALGSGVFILGGTLALAVALLTVSVQAIQAARANPVGALRYE